MLRCPRTGLPLTAATPALLAEVNRRIARADGGGILNRAGNPVREPLDGALVPSDGSAAYPIRDGIAVLLAEEAVALPLP